MEFQQKTFAPNSYYSNSNGFFQKEFNELTDKIPKQGKAETLHGELIRAVNRLYHEYTNNGNGNAVEYKTEYETYSCSYCNGSGEVENENFYDDGDGIEVVEEFEICDVCCGSGEEEEEDEIYDGINEFFQYFISLISDNVSPEAVKDVITIIENCGESDYSVYFNDSNIEKYDKMIDYVIQYIMTNEDVLL